MISSDQHIAPIGVHLTHKKAVTTDESVSGDRSLRILPSKTCSPCNHVTWEGVDGAILDPDATYRFSADAKVTDGSQTASNSLERTA